MYIRPLARRLPRLPFPSSPMSSSSSSTPPANPIPKPSLPKLTDVYASAPSLPSQPSPFPFPLHGSTIDNHADHGIESTTDIAPPLHPSTTFVQPEPGQGQIYSRVSNVTRLRVEAIIGQLEGGQAVTYASGLAAATALIHAVKPRRVYSEAGYHGVKAAFAYWKERQVKGSPPVEFLTEPQIQHLYNNPPSTLPPPYSPSTSHLDRPLDLIWLEAPNNPYATLADIEWYAELAHRTGALLAIDSTLSTPLGMRPLTHGAHVVMHASTKYLSGHSDLLGGVLITPSVDLHTQLITERVIDGAVMGTLETWLLLRSLRTFHLRVHQQCRSVQSVVRWLDEQRVKTGKIVAVHHPCLEGHPSYGLSEKYLRLWPATFSVEVRGGEEAAVKFAKKLMLFQLATSLGGVESLVDWRYQYDKTVSPGLLRVSIGVEEVEDLLADLQQAIDQI